MADDDFYFGEHGPTPVEYRVTGACGLFVFCVVLVMAVRGYSLTTASHSHLQYFYFSVFISSCLEIPRYALFVTDAEYTSRASYACHMLAGLFYFFSLSIVCYMWSCVVNLGTLSTLIYSLSGLVVANVFLGSVLIFAAVACLTASSLSDFFHSDLFILFVAEEIVQSLLYTTGLTLYGVRMIFKLQYAQGTALSVLQKLLVRITVTLGFTSMASLLRLIMCCLQIASYKTDFSLSSSSFPHYGFLWFTLAEFIPRGGSSLALIVFMSKRSHQGSRNEIRQRFIGSENMHTIVSSGKYSSSSGMENSSMSSINGKLYDMERDSLFNNKNIKGSSHSDTLTEELISVK